MPGAKELLISTIELDEEIQPRVKMSQAIVDEYAELLESGVKLPPVTVFCDPKTSANRLVDGFHRLAAAKNIGREKIGAKIIRGDKRDAILFSVGANADHGHRRTNADKVRSVEIMMNDLRWSRWSDSRIAEQCKVSQDFVSAHRPLKSDLSGPEIRTDKNGREMNVANIGRKPKSKPTEPAPDAPKLSQVNGHAVPDPPDVAELRANGKIPAQAIVTVFEPEELTELADVIEQHAEATAIADDLSDDDWVANLPLSTKLTSPQNLRIFKTDALFYRHLEAARNTFKHHAARLKPKRYGGEFTRRVQSFLSTNHPKDWFVCPEVKDGGCGGKGLVEELNLQCPKCQGRGYWIPR